MAVSDERIEEILQEMVDNQTDDGWCGFPDNLTEEENIELGKRVTRATVEDRIKVILDVAFDIFGHMSDVNLEIDSYDDMELLKLKEAMRFQKEDANDLLMDMYSSNKIKEFYLIELTTDGSPENNAGVEEKTKEIQALLDGEFKDDIERISTYLKKIIELSDKITADVDGRL